MGTKKDFEIERLVKVDTTGPRGPGFPDTPFSATLCFTAVQDYFSRYSLGIRCSAKGRTKKTALREAAKAFFSMDGPKKCELAKKKIERRRGGMKERTRDEKKREEKKIL